MQCLLGLCCIFGDSSLQSFGVPEGASVLATTAQASQAGAFGQHATWLKLDGGRCESMISLFTLLKCSPLSAQQAGCDLQGRTLGNPIHSPTDVHARANAEQPHAPTPALPQRCTPTPPEHTH